MFEQTTARSSVAVPVMSMGVYLVGSRSHHGCHGFADIFSLLVIKDIFSSVYIPGRCMYPSLNAYSQEISIRVPSPLSLILGNGCLVTVEFNRGGGGRVRVGGSWGRANFNGQIFGWSATSACGLKEDALFGRVLTIGVDNELLCPRLA